MRTIYVTTTKSKNCKYQTWYAYNSARYMGLLDVTKGEMIDRIGCERVKVVCKVGEMFGGSGDEWYRHIYNCILKSLIKKDMVKKVECGEYALSLSPFDK